MQQSNYEFWIDINLPQSIMYWLKDIYNLNVYTFWQLGFATTTDVEILKDAESHQNFLIITTKDYDFIQLVENNDSKTKNIIN